jgi:hypothetical protein
MVKPPETGFAPNEQEAIVFGQMQFYSNGKLAQYTGKSNQMIATHISIYSEQKPLNTSQFKPGELAFKSMLADEGHFSAKLPVGRYYIVEFNYSGVTRYPLGLRTYMPILAIKIATPKVVIFDVLPQRATYIGTFIHRVDSVAKPGNIIEKNFGMDIVDEFDECRAWFLAKYPLGTQSIVSGISTFIPFIAPEK